MLMSDDDIQRIPLQFFRTFSGVYFENFLNFSKNFHENSLFSLQLVLQYAKFGQNSRKRRLHEIFKIEEPC